MTSVAAVSGAVQPCRGLHRRTLVFVALLFALIAIMHAGAASAGNGSRERQAAIDELATLDAEGLAYDRQACAENRIANVKARVEAKGSAFPDAADYCPAVVDAAAARGLSVELYINLYLQARYGKANILDASEMRLVAHGEDSKTAIAILRAASQGATSYTDLVGKRHPLAPALAYDAGHWFGQVRPDKILLISDPSELRLSRRACYDPLATTIAVNGRAMPATQACAIIGGNAGKRFAR